MNAVISAMVKARDTKLRILFLVFNTQVKLILYVGYHAHHPFNTHFAINKGAWLNIYVFIYFLHLILSYNVMYGRVSNIFVCMNAVNSAMFTPRDFKLSIFILVPPTQIKLSWYVAYHAHRLSKIYFVCMSAVISAMVTARDTKLNILIPRFKTQVNNIFYFAYHAHTPLL